MLSFKNEVEEHENCYRIAHLQIFFSFLNWIALMIFDRTFQLQSKLWSKFVLKLDEMKCIPCPVGRVVHNMTLTKFTFSWKDEAYLHTEICFGNYDSLMKCNFSFISAMLEKLGFETSKSQQCYRNWGLKHQNIARQKWKLLI